VPLGSGGPRDAAPSGGPGSIRKADVNAVTALVYSAAEPGLDATLILAHGAGAGQRSPFMVAAAQALAGAGVDTVTFDFPYTQRGRRLPDRQPVLEECYRRVIGAVAASDASHGRLFIGGKSMGGRIATHVASADPTRSIGGVVVLGYPLHPPGRPEERRDAHFPTIQCPTLFVQGSRDAFGSPDELRPALARLPQAAALHVVAGGDHSFKIARASRVQQAGALDEVYRAIVDWIRTRA
jgi:predicted alpha/beta-hydrolase family hydrolase